MFVYTMFNLQCKWFKGKTEIKKNETFEIEHDGLTHRLIIHSATLNDTGKYKCTFDDQTTFCNLTVRGVYCLHQSNVIKAIHVSLLETLFCYYQRINVEWKNLHCSIVIIIFLLYKNFKKICTIPFFHDYFQYKII